MSKTTHHTLPGVHSAPNIQTAPDIYEIENVAADPDGLIEQAMWKIRPWDGKVVLDLGAGTGFHIPRFHARAQHVIAVEPHGPSRLRGMARVAKLGLEHASVMTGSAEQLLLPDHSVDICHARFAYFFAPNCAPGLRELERVMRPGGTAFIIDNDLRHGTFASWLRQSPEWQKVSPNEVEQFWADHGFTLTRIASEWRFTNRADLEAVVRLEFGNTLAEKLLTIHDGTGVEYGYCLYHRQYL
jgi:ubiquinone/menaquinone biosynthesis C-methylase UbiE